MTDELYGLFRRNFPFAVREEETARRVLASADHVIERRADGRLMGAAVTQGGTILMLCVDEAYRRRGVSSALLDEAERVLWADGCREITVGAGSGYLVPGVPTSKRYYDAVNEALYPGLDESASRFFEKRGYAHSWDCNCFDMRFPLSECRAPDWEIGQAANGVIYRWAAPEDRAAVCACVDDAWPDFTQYYREEALYGADPARHVMLAEAEGVAAGALMVSLEAEGKGVGSVGCTAVRHAYRGRRIAVNMVTLSTAFLKTAGMRDAFLGYTYSGLDYMYGLAGYKICVYYMMAKKTLI